MKISCFLIEPWQEEIIRKNLSDHELKIFSEPLNPKNISEVKDSEIIVSRARFLNLKFLKDTLVNFTNLKLIATMSTGFDHIDLNYCQEKNISISSVPSYGENSVAEYAFALILSISRKIHLAKKSLKDSSITPKKLIGFDLNKKTLGVIGTGKIGINVVKIAKSFEMEVLAYDIFQNKEASEKYNFRYVSLEELLKNSEIITLHAPLTSETHHLLNKTNFPLLKRNAVIINTARGELIETIALIEFLKNNPESFAGLDVFEGESDNLSDNNFLEKLKQLPNTLLTPHNASNTREAKQRILNTTIENIKNFIEGRPINLVC